MVFFYSIIQLLSVIKVAVSIHVGGKENILYHAMITHGR